MAKACMQVELDRKEIDDAIIEAAKKHADGPTGGVEVELLYADDEEECGPTELSGAIVSFQWVKRT
jgi:hypothetical protein